MGNTVNLAYDIQEAVDFDNSFGWTLHNGSKKVR